MLLGSHAVKSWSSTQAVIALSSGEAELAGATKAAAIALGMKSLMRDFGILTAPRVWTDSSAALGMCGRQGLGKVRHLDCAYLYIQNQCQKGNELY